MVRIYVAIGGLLVALLLAAFVGPIFVDWTQYRERFEAEASRILGREVTVGGEATARLLPFPSVAFEDVLIAEDGGLALDIERFEMDLELAPFLRGEYLIFDMRMVSPRLRVALDEANTLPAASDTRTIDGDAISIERLEIVDGTVRASTADGTATATNVDMVVRADTLFGPWIGEGAATVAGERLDLDVTTGRYRGAEEGIRLLVGLETDALPLPIALAGDVVAHAGAISYVGELSANRTEGTAIALTGTFAATPGTATVEEYRMAIGERDDPYVVVGEASVSAGSNARFDLELRGQRLETERIAPDALPQGPTLTERIDALERLANRLPRLPIDGEVNVSLPAIVLPEGVGQDVRLVANATDGAWRISEASILLPGRTRVEASGELAVEPALLFEGEFAAVSRQPTGLATWLGNPVTETLRGVGTIGAGGNVVLSRDRQVVDDLRLIVGDQSLSGRYAAGEGQRGITLAADTLDLDNARAALQAALGSEWRATFDIAFDLDLASVAFDGTSARDLMVQGTLADGTATFDALAVADLAGVALDITGTFAPGNGSESQLAIRVDAEEPAASLALLAERTGGQWAQLLASRAEALAALVGTIDIAWIDPKAPIGFEAEFAAGGAEWTFGGSLFVEQGEASAIQLASMTASVEGPLGSLLRVGNLPVAGKPDRPVSVQAEYERTAEGHRADVSLASENDSASLTAVASGDEAFVRTETEIESLSPYAEALGSALAGRLDTSVDGLVDASYDGAFWTAQIEELQLGDTLLTGRMVGNEWRWQGTLDTGTLSLPWIATLPIGDGTDPIADPNAPFGSSPLPPIDMLLSLRARVVDLPFDGTAEDASLRLRVTEDAVSVEELSAAFGGGTVEGDLTIRNSQNGVLASANGAIVNAGTDLLPSPLRERLSAGTLAMDASVEATGTTMNELVASATGAGTATITDPTIVDLDPFAMVRLYERADALTEPPTDADVREALVAEAFDGHFEPGAISANASIGSGTVRLSVPPFSDEGTVVTGRGRVDLSTGEATGEARITFAVPDDRGTGGNPTIRIAIEDDGGTEIDVGPLTGFLNLRAFEIERERVAALRAALVERQRLRRESLLFQEQRREAEREAEREERRLEEARAAERARRTPMQTPTLNFDGLATSLSE